MAVHFKLYQSHTVLKVTVEKLTKSIQNKKNPNGKQQEVYLQMGTYYGMVRGLKPTQDRT